MNIRELAQENVVTASPDTPVGELAQLMRDHNVGSVVITSDEHPVGVVTDRDITVEVVSRGDDPRQKSAEEVMSEQVIFAQADKDVDDVVREVSKQTVRRIPIVQDDRLVGIVTLDDLYLHYVESLQKLGGIIFREAASPPKP